MKIQFKNIGFFLLILAAGVGGFSSCSNDTWDDHYSVNKELVSGNTLWETIQANPDLKKFAWVLKKTGYNDVLSKSQMYTVWAPVDSVLKGMDTSATSISTELKASLAKEFVQNHVAKFSYSASGAVDSKVALLNTKTKEFKSQGNVYSFGESKLIQPNMVSSNGILHLIDGKLPFFDNIWEYMAKDLRLDSVKNYLYSFDKINFDESKSIPGDVNDEGKIVYLDSVLFNDNKMFRILGKLNNEDSSYVAILPTNSAWEKSYNKIKDYYLYYYPKTGTTSAADKYTADTLQRNYTRLALTQDLVFSNKMQDKSKDTLISTARNKFPHPGYLFEGAGKVTASNGTVYTTDDLKFNHWESWNQNIVVEAEKSIGRAPSLFSNVFDRTYSAGIYADSISKNRYIEVIPNTSSADVNVVFDIPNTLSRKLNDDGTIAGARYNIYCVFLPTSMKTLNPKPSIVNFVLTYRNDEGVITNIPIDNNKKNFIIAKDVITKQLVASNVAFPFCEYGLPSTPNVKLKVASKVKREETVSYTRELLIDCIILEPVH